jgi:hypothetical protein
VAIKKDKEYEDRFEEPRIDFRGAAYGRGPTDTNDRMTDMEVKQAQAIEERCGPATSPTHNLPVVKGGAVPWGRCC